MSTVRVPPPRKGTKAPKRGQGRGKSAPQEVQSWVFRYRYQLRPFVVMGVVLMIALIVDDPAWLAAGYLTAVSVLLLDVLARRANESTQLQILSAYAAIRLGNARHRLYAIGCLVAAGAWSVWSVFGGVRPYLILPFATFLVAWPYFKRSTRKQLMDIVYSPDLKGSKLREAEATASRIHNGWGPITRQGRIHLAELDGLAFDPHSTVVDLTLRAGQSARSLAYATTREALISAFDAPENSLRVEGRPSKVPGKPPRAREVRLRFITDDPNTESLGAPPADVETMGRFETSHPVDYVDGVHTLITGKSGHGKSVIMNLAVRRKVRRGWAVLAIDLKPGALELGTWEPVLAYLADVPDKVTRILTGLIGEMIWRGAEMKAQGIRQWVPTADHPNICLAVDEVQELHQVKGAMKLLIRLAQLGRAYGFELLVATQFPKDSNLPSDIMAQITQIFCCHLEKPGHDRVVFGENATAEGWTASAIPSATKGTFLVRSPLYTHPSRARSWFMEVKEILAEMPTMTRTALNRPWVPGSAYEVVGGPQTALESPAGDDWDDDTVDAVIVSEIPSETILEAIRAGHGTTDAIVKATEISRTAVNLILRKLNESGRIAKDGDRATTLRPWRVVE